MLNSFSNSMMSSTVSSESAPKSFVKLASRVTSLSSTPSFSTMIVFTLLAMSDILKSAFIKFRLQRNNLYTALTKRRANKVKKIGIIPSRYGSSRLPGKPLLLIGNKPMIEHVWRRAKACALLSEVLVATDDERIKAHIENLGGQAVLTPSALPSGTDRCAFALEAMGANLDANDLVLNIQGDEPFVDQGHLVSLIGLFDDLERRIGTLACPANSMVEVQNTARPKVVLGANGDALYFSRQMVPYHRNGHEGIGPAESYYLHIGLYAYRVAALREIVQLEPSQLEITEQLEQLRWLEAGHKIGVGLVTAPGLGVDTPEDLARANAHYARLIEEGYE